MNRTVFGHYGEHRLNRTIITKFDRYTLKRYLTYAFEILKIYKMKRLHFTCRNYTLHIGIEIEVGWIQF